MISRLTCGIVIFDEASEIQKLIPRLQLELSEYEIEWIFILNHEQIDIRQPIKKWLNTHLPSAIIIENPANNLGTARQLILTSATNEFIYMTDPDIETSTGSVRALLVAAGSSDQDVAKLKHEFIMGYGGQVLHQSENKILQSTFTLLAKLSRFLPFAFQTQNHALEKWVDHIPTCHLLLKKSEAVKIGGFSSSFDRCGEYLDFTHRASGHQFRFIYLPGSRVIHWQNMTLMGWVKKIFTYGRVQILTQKKKLKHGLRPYRLIPLLALCVFVIASFYSVQFFILSVFSITIMGLLNPGFFGLAITIFSLYLRCQCF